MSTKTGRVAGVVPEVWPWKQEGKKAVETSLLNGFRSLSGDRLAHVPLIPDACHGMGVSFAT
jgi:hypothetical protein